ncbi:MULTISPECIES: hypothetical protein [unclassified Streptomyces]|uniref:hypothetical protein n=1 Tax=unclassified Streptomyces TaxID=2593676 RepID=UPI002254B4D3|nr:MULTISPECIES: hypothetical protein [unclassified Streptomyces]MCX4991950.1 hypothetical protein [Streptomyces sp. NBC_00568]MCX5002814.1 hypothetical protein [Streptomyces sp. NBC_00638]
MVLGSDLRRGNARAVAATAVLVLAAALTACSDDSGGTSTAPPTPSVDQSTSAQPSATAPSDPAAAEKEIKQNWEKFFDPAVSTKDKQAVLENGDQMAQVLQGFSGDQRGQQVKAKVGKVEFTSPTDANVTYTLTLNGATALPNASGTAVEQDGTWKVSVKTLCALVQLSGDASSSAAPGC